MKCNDMVDQYNGPGAPSQYFPKNKNQEGVPWVDYIWRMCVSYKKLNQITYSFDYPFQSCDDAIVHIGKATYCLSVDLDSGYL